MRFGHPRQQALDGHTERQAAIGVGLGIEEQLHMARAIGCDPANIRHGQIVEIRLRPQHLSTLIVDVKEVLQVRECVGPAHRLYVGEWQGQAITARELEHLFGLKGAFDVQMKLGLG